MFSRVCRLAKEVGKPVIIHYRGTASRANECLWIMKSNLPKDQMVYWHHFNETEEMAREVEASRYKSSVGSRDRFEKNSSNQGRPTAYNEEDMSE